MTFYEVLTAAVNDLLTHGYDSQKRLEDWVKKIRESAQRELIPEYKLQAEIEKNLNTIFSRLVTRGGLVAKGVPVYTLDRLKPALRAELDRRTAISQKLVTQNQRDAINTVIKRFEGWASSVPPGGTKVQDRLESKRAIKKSIGQLQYIQRRVNIDQGHKLVANLNEIVAQDGGAIAAIWKSHWRQAGYDYREEHKDMDGKVYALRGNWALKKGLMVAGPNGYIDDIERPGEKPFCRCFYQYIYNLKYLPDDMLTQKYRDSIHALKRA